MVDPTGNEPLGGDRSQSADSRTHPSLGRKGLPRPMSGGKGNGKGKGLGGRRYRKSFVDSIHGITKGDLRPNVPGGHRGESEGADNARRMARRGGVKRISSSIYDEARMAMRSRLSQVLAIICILVDHVERKTVTTSDVIFALKRIGSPIYGFDKGTFVERKRPRRHTTSAVLQDQPVIS